MVDLATFNPGSVADLLKALTDQTGEIAGAWWLDNRARVAGYLQILAEGTLETARQLAAGEIGQEEATEIMRMHADAFADTITFSVFMTEVLAQKLLDATLKLVSAAIRSKTRVDLYPMLAKPG